MSNTSPAHARIVCWSRRLRGFSARAAMGRRRGPNAWCPLEAVYAWHWPYLPTTPLAPLAAPDHDGAEAAARCMLDVAVEAVDAHGLVAPIECVVLWQGAAGALLDASKGAEMLVVGSAGGAGSSGRSSDPSARRCRTTPHARS